MTEKESRLNDLRELAEHAASVHFSLLPLCLGLGVAVGFSKAANVERSWQQLRDVAEMAKALSGTKPESVFSDAAAYKRQTATPDSDTSQWSAPGVDPPVWALTHRVPGKLCPECYGFFHGCVSTHYVAMLGLAGAPRSLVQLVLSPTLFFARQVLFSVHFTPIADNDGMSNCKGAAVDSADMKVIRQRIEVLKEVAADDYPCLGRLVLLLQNLNAAVETSLVTRHRLGCSTKDTATCIHSEICLRMIYSREAEEISETSGSA